MKKLLKILLSIILVMSLFSCKKKEEPVRLSTPAITLSEDGSISVSKVENATKYLFSVSNTLDTIDKVESIELDLSSYKLDYSTYIKCKAISSDTNYLESEYSNVVFRTYLNNTFDETLLNPLSDNLFSNEYSVNLTGESLVIGFSYDSSYNDESFKIKINDSNEITINNSSFYDSLVGISTSLSKIKVLSESKDLISLKVSNISYTTNTSFNDTNNSVSYTKVCSNKAYKDDEIKTLSAKETTIENMITNNIDSLFVSSGYIVSRNNDNSLSSYLYDIDTNKYIKVESYSLYKTGLSYSYDESNSKFNISYTQANNLIESNEYYFNDGDFVNCLIYKDLNNNKYYAEVISKDNSKSLDALSKTFSVTVPTNDHVDITLNKNNYKLNEVVNVTLELESSYSLKSLKLERFNDSTIELSFSSVTNSYNFNYLPLDKIVISLYKTTYEVLKKDSDNYYYYTKVVYDLEKDEYSYDYLYKIEESSINDLSSENVIKLVKGYIYDLDSDTKRLTLISLKENNEFDSLSVISLSKLNTSFILATNPTTTNYIRYNTSNTFDDLGLSLYKYIEVLLVYSSEYNNAYGELLYIDNSKSLTDISASISLEKGESLSNIEIINEKTTHHFGDKVTIKINLDDTEMIDSVKFNNEAVELDNNNEAEITLSFTNLIELTTSAKEVTVTYTIVGDSLKDDISMFYTDTDTIDGTIYMQRKKPVYSTTSKGKIKSIKVYINACSSGSISLYASSSALTSVTDDVLLSTNTITDETLTSEFILTKDATYFYLSSKCSTLEVSKIEVVVIEE